MTLFQAQNINSGRLRVRRRPITQMKGCSSRLKALPSRPSTNSSETLQESQKYPLVWTLHSVAFRPTEMESNMEELRYWYHDSSWYHDWSVTSRFCLEYQRLLSVDITSVFVVLGFFLSWPSSISLQRAGAIISLWHFCFDREDKNGWTILLSSSSWPHSSLYPRVSDLLIKVDQSGMESVPVGSRKGGKKSHGRGTSTVPGHQDKLQVFGQQNLCPPARIPTPELPGCCKTPHRTDRCAPDRSTHTRAKINGSGVLLGADTCLSFHIMA